MTECNIQNIERSLDVNKSEQILNSFLKSEGLTSDIIFSDSNLEVSYITLIDSNGNRMASGGGKGKHHHIGSVAEAIEHYLFGLGTKNSSYKKLAIKSIAEQSIFENDFYLHHIFNENKNDEIEYIKFNSFNNKQEWKIPASIVDPGIYEDGVQKSNSENQLRKFSTNNGCALGVTLNDSLLHGLNECIERHYESLLYQEILGLNTQIKWIVFNDSLCTDIKIKKEKIEKLFGKVIIIYCKTEATSFVAFSILIDAEDKYCFTSIGAGSSFYLRVAVQRAIDELAQSLKLKTSPISETTEWKLEETIFNKMFESNNQLKHLKNISLANINSFVTNSDEDNYPFFEFTVEDQLNYLLKNLIQNSINPLYRVIKTNQKIVVTQVFVPEFDRFFVIRKGNLVVPNIYYKINV